MNSIELKKCLETQFGLVCRDPYRSKALCFDLRNGEAIYLKRKGTDRGSNLEPFHKFPLVVHLKFEEGIKNLISAHQLHNSIQVGGPTKSTGYITLRDSHSMKHSQTPTGLALSVSSTHAMKLLLNHICGEEISHSEYQTETTTQAPHIYRHELEGIQISSVRKEQQRLRAQLLAGKPAGTCSICGNQFPVDFLVAAHIKPRQFCSDDEKRDLNNVATLMCKTGCDAAYENGYILVEQGTVIKNQARVTTPELDGFLAKIAGRSVSNWAQSEAYYIQHAQMHQERVA